MPFNVEGHLRIIVIEWGDVRGDRPTDRPTAQGDARLINRMTRCAFVIIYLLLLLLLFSVAGDKGGRFCY